MNSVCFSPNGEKLISGDDEFILLWNSENNEKTEYVDKLEGKKKI